METLVLLTKIFGISFTSGINLYATIGLVGLAIRFNLIQNLPEQLNILANEYVIGTALIMYTCEFVADKIPAFDSIWDSVHTFIRPFAAAMLALMAVGDCPLYMKIIVFILAGGVALTSHTAKAGIRLVANTSPEPFSNSILSVAEDIGVFALVALIITHPFIAASIILVLLAIILWQGPKLVGFTFFMFKSLALKIQSLLPAEKHINNEIMPSTFDNYLSKTLDEGEKVYLTLESTFKGPKKGSGYMVVSESRLIILYKTWFMVRHLEFDIPEMNRLSFQSNFLTDRISFNHNNKQIVLVLFKSNSRKLADIKNIFCSLEADIQETVPEMSMSQAGAS